LPSPESRSENRPAQSSADVISPGSATERGDLGPVALLGMVIGDVGAASLISQRSLATRENFHYACRVRRHLDGRLLSKSLLFAAWQE
jgi:hypothetical protein